MITTEEKPQRAKPVRNRKFVFFKQVSCKDRRERLIFQRRVKQQFTGTEYGKLVDEVINFMAAQLLEGKMYKLPHQMGHMFIRQKKRSSSKPFLSWGMRKEGDKKPAMIQSDEPVRKLVWFKTHVKVQNKKAYIFRTMKPMKLKMREAVLQKKSFIFFDENVKRGK